MLGAQRLFSRLLIKKHRSYSTFLHKNTFFYKNICVYQKKVVILRRK